MRWDGEGVEGRVGWSITKEGRSWLEAIELWG